jgi:protein gp37
VGETSIEWTDHSVSPVRARDKATGKVFHFCEKISPGCAHCYAATMAKRFGLPDYVKANRDKVEFFLDRQKLVEVLRRKKPTRYFWEDCSDLFGDWVHDGWLDRCFAVMAATPQHTHQVLTKRPERMTAYMAALQSDADQHAPRTVEKRFTPAQLLNLRMIAGAAQPGGILGRAFDTPWPLPNVWLGVSVEDRQRKARIDQLRGVPAAVRFLSLEPLLEDLGMLDLTGIHWVIVGGESGSGARPMDVAWARSLVEQCKAAAVPVFVKQMGSMPFDSSQEFCRFDSEQQWVCKARSWLGGISGGGTKYKAAEKVVCVDAKGRWCEMGRDFMRATAEGAYPVRACPQLRLWDRKGGDINEFPADLRVREFPTTKEQP